MKKALILVAIVLLQFILHSALAYVPPYWMIMSKTADNHGKGIYLVDQDVIFQSASGEPLIVNERWIIAGDNEMRLEVTGRRQLKDQVRLTFVYDDGRRYFIDGNGVKKIARVPAEFFERLFHFRLSKNIKPFLVSAKIVPPETLKSEPHKVTKTRPRPEPENYVQLGRSGGVVAYNIGNLWVEQDQFVIRKVRYPSAVEVVAKNYQSHTGGLLLPKEREITFDGQQVQVVVNAVSSVANTPKVKAALNQSSLNFGAEPTLAVVLPNETVIREFYSRLR